MGQNVQIPAPLLASCVTLGKLLNLSGLQLPHLRPEDDIVLDSGKEGPVMTTALSRRKASNHGLH